MTDVLTDAEARVPVYAATQKAEQEHAVALVREEIGRAIYEAAKQQLPILERAIREDFRPWLERITAIAQQTGDYPAPIRQAVETIAQTCERGPRQLREGLTAYEGLRWADLVWKDGRQVDVNQRAWLIARIRQQLKSFDGLLSAMQSQRGQAETFIREAGWPRRSGGGGGPVGIIPEAPRPGVVVETGGAPRPPV